jgi:putative membrane protein
MAELIIRWIINALGVVIAGALFPSLISYDNWQSVAIFALVLGLLNAVLRPILAFLTCPLYILTLGLITIIINAIVFWIAGSLPLGVHVSGFLGALVGALIVSVVSFIMSMVIRKPERKK